MRAYTGIILMLYMLCLMGCRRPEEQLECFDRSFQSEQLKPLINKLVKGFNDTLQNWIYVRKYEGVQLLRSVNWKIDEAVFLDPQKNNAILLLLEQDTSKYTTIPTGEGGPEKKRPTSFDNISLIFANKENDQWYYYYQSMPLMVVPRNRKINEVPVPLSFEELSKTGRINMIQSYYKKGTCEYCTDFFSKWDINNLKKQHKKINGYN